MNRTEAQDTTNSSLHNYTRNIRGAVALEYILIMALVAIAMIGAFRAWGEKTRENIEDVGAKPVGGYDASTGVGGALEAP